MPSSSYGYLVVAILISPILGVFLESITRDVFLIYTIDFKSWVHNIPAFILSGFSKAILGLVISLPVVLFYGVPVYFLLKKIKLQTVWMYGLFSLLPASIGPLVFLFRQDSYPESFSLYSTALAALDGFFTAIIFWLIAVFIPTRRGVEN